MPCPAKKKWIHKLKKGGLHRSLGVATGKKIPRARIVSASKKKGKVGKQARAALTLAKLRRRNR